MSEGPIEQLVKDSGEKAFNFAYRLTGNTDEAKDLVQEAFYRVLRAWHKYDAAQPLENWFFTILRHVYVDAARRPDRVVPLESGEEERAPGEHLGLSDPDPAALEVLERRETGERVRRALARLSVEHRAVLTLCDLQGMRYEEIARTLDLPLGTVRSRVARAREALKRLLAGEAALYGMS